MYLVMKGIFSLSASDAMLRKSEKRVFQSKNLKLALKWRQCTVSIRHCILYHLVSIFPAARQIAILQRN